jgi:hypothetical protein
MQVYLPIAEISVNAFLLLGLGGMVGILSGMFGVGGGFLMTPLLFFIGIPPAVAVATEANQIVASSFSGALAHFRKKSVDFKMGVVLLSGGLLGAAFGVVVFNYLKSLGQVDLLVRLCYVVFLGIIGGLMFIESLRAMRRSKKSHFGQKIAPTGMGPQASFQNKVSDIWSLYIRHPTFSCRDFSGYFISHHGCWWRIYYGSCHDLPFGYAHESGCGNIVVPDYLCDGLYHALARHNQLYG